jgi:hypothetical protein
MQEMLRMSTTFSKTIIHTFSVFNATFRSVSRSVLATVCSVLCFSSSKLHGYSNKLFLWHIPTKRSLAEHGLDSREKRWPKATPNNALTKQFLQWSNCVRANYSSIVEERLTVNTVRRRIRLLSQTLPVSLNFVTNRCIVVLFGTSLSR